MSRNYSRHKKTRKAVSWKGWGKVAPKGKQRTLMYKKCGSRCFLGTKTPGDKQHPDFPICSKGTCKINPKGVYAAYIRARQWGKPSRSYRGKTRPRMKQRYYTRIARKAKKMLESRGYHVGN